LIRVTTAATIDAVSDRRILLSGTARTLRGQVTSSGWTLEGAMNAEGRRLAAARVQGVAPQFTDDSRPEVGRRM
jgi:hypothetical protein